MTLAEAKKAIAEIEKIPDRLQGHHPRIWQGLPRRLGGSNSILMCARDHYLGIDCVVRYR